MQVRNHGKYTQMRKNNPRGIGRCDYSGLMVAHHKMKNQYQYRGQGLVNTGFMVYEKFLDKPNPQDLTPLIKMDPIPLNNARPDNIVDVIPDVTLELDVSGNTNITLTQDQILNSNFVFRGVLTGNVTIFFAGATTIVPPPGTGGGTFQGGSFIGFFAFNQTTGPFSLTMQIYNNSSSNVVLIRNQAMLLCNDGYTIHIINPNYQRAT